MKLFLRFFFVISICFFSTSLYSQEGTEEDAALKLEHVEPLYRDIIRDLGARKGEQEWNIRTGVTNEVEFHTYGLNLEYEWAVGDRFGLEVEIPFTFYDNPSYPGTEVPSNRLEGISVGGQYTFLVSEKLQTSMAFGNRVELKFMDLPEISLNNLTQGVLMNPYLVAAKRISNSWHTMVYTGPRYLIGWNSNDNNFAYEINTSVHFRLPESDNFFGLEVNQTIEEGILKTVLRPQVKLEISNSIQIGFIPGLSLNPEEELLSSFFRIIFEPD